MGQKVHPIGFRLGQTQNHSSQWFAQKMNYSQFLLEDNYLRQILLKYSKKLDRIDIIRKSDDHIEIQLHTESIILSRKNFRQLQDLVKQSIQKYRNNSDKLKLRISRVSSSLNALNASDVAQFLVNRLEERTAYRVAIQKLFKRKLNYFQYKGIKIQISGRLNGAEIARSKWVRKGRLPLQTLNANIDYCFKKASTIYGILGVKIWIFK